MRLAKVTKHTVRTGELPLLGPSTSNSWNKYLPGKYFSLFFCCFLSPRHLLGDLGRPSAQVSWQYATIASRRCRENDSWLGVFSALYEDARSGARRPAAARQPGLDKRPDEIPLVAHTQKHGCPLLASLASAI